jgi:DHA3 family macrolide efflux protein-like MFS transporter
MKPEGNLAPIFSRIFGTNPGAGMALLYVLCALCMLLVGLVGYAFPVLRHVEDIVPDHDTKVATPTTVSFPKTASDCAGCR